MNRIKLKQAESNFLERYPGGFQNVEMQQIAKKHSMEKMITLTQELFAKEKFLYPKEILESMNKIVGKATMVSLFEKPKFRDFAKSIGVDEREALCHGLKEFLHGDQSQGFELMRDILSMEKLAKWSIMTTFGIYFRPDFEVFIKPTTVKGIIELLDLPLIYKPTPTWEFYASYRELFNNLKHEVSPLLSPNNAAFSGFLWMSLEGR